MAITRITLFRAHPGQADALARQLAVNVREVRAAIPESDLIVIATGTKISGNAEYHSAIVATYPDQAALDAYDVHPAHLATRDRMNGFVADRQIMVYQVAD